jgi:hypothetical protein
LKKPHMLRFFCACTFCSVEIHSRDGFFAVVIQLFFASQFYDVVLISVWPWLKWIATNQHRSAKVLKK